MCKDLQHGTSRGPPTKKAKEELTWKTTHEQIFSHCLLDWPASEKDFEDLGGLDGLSVCFHGSISKQTSRGDRLVEFV